MWCSLEKCARLGAFIGQQTRHVDPTLGQYWPSVGSTCLFSRVASSKSCIWRPCQRPRFTMPPNNLISDAAFRRQNLTSFTKWHIRFFWWCVNQKETSYIQSDCTMSNYIFCNVFRSFYLNIINGQGMSMCQLVMFIVACIYHNSYGT